MGCFSYILDSSNSSSITFWTSQFGSSSRSNWTVNSNGILQKGHSITIWTKFYPILTPSLSSWQKWTFYKLSILCHVPIVDFFLTPFLPFLVHVVIECPLKYSTFEGTFDFSGKNKYYFCRFFFTITKSKCLASLSADLNSFDYIFFFLRETSKKIETR